jgi:phosphodiesterase/alkaline phosphatase D-like protein
MPIRPAADPNEPLRTHRRFRYGSLAEFFLLDVRQYRERNASDA